MKEHNRIEIGASVYDLEKSRHIYCNRGVVIPSDEEILLLLGVEDVNSPGFVNVLTKAYLTLPSFFRTYDSFKSVLDEFKRRGITDID